MQNRMLSVMAALTLLCAGGCVSIHKDELVMTPVAPGPNEVVIVDQAMIMMDASGSMALHNKWGWSKNLVYDFIDAMPVGNYGAGLSTFGGEWRMDWHFYLPTPFERPLMTERTREAHLLFGSTYLAEALLDYRPLVSDYNGHTAVILFSDGKAEEPIEALQAVADLMVLADGPLCIYTVQIGDNEEAGLLLHDLATSTPCGFGVHADSIHSPTGMERFIRAVFFGQRPPAVVMDRPGVLDQGLLFGSGKAYLRPEYGVYLDDIARSMEANPAMRLRVEGHSDDLGSPARNEALSMQRAQAVKNALIERGVDGKRIDVVGYGAQEPRVPNDTPANRQLNRRVDLVVID